MDGTKNQKGLQDVKIKIMKATKKPVTIDYFPMTTIPKFSDIQEWLDEFGDKMEDVFELGTEDLYVKTLEGTSYVVSDLDMIIRGVNGEYYPCKKDIFEKTYDYENNK